MEVDRRLLVRVLWVMYGEWNTQNVDMPSDDPGYYCAYCVMNEVRAALGLPPNPTSGEPCHEARGKS